VSDKTKQNEVDDIEEIFDRASPLPWLYNTTTNIDDIDIDSRSPQETDEIAYFGPASSSSHRTHSSKMMSNSNSSTSFNMRPNVKNRLNKVNKRQVMFAGNKKVIRVNSRQDIVYKSNNLNNSINPPDDFDNNSIRLNSIQRTKKKQMWNKLRYKAKNILPFVRDINIIDKYSRTIFPSLFLLFNVCYWCFYFVQSTYIYNIENNLH
jgi:hypothetical protein